MRNRDKPAFPTGQEMIEDGTGLTKLEYTTIQIFSSGSGMAVTPEQALDLANQVFDKLEEDET